MPSNPYPSRFQRTTVVIGSINQILRDVVLVMLTLTLPRRDRAVTRQEAVSEWTLLSQYCTFRTVLGVGGQTGKR